MKRFTISHNLWHSTHLNSVSAILVFVGNQMVDVPFMQSTHEDPGVQMIFLQKIVVRMPKVQA